MARIGHAIVNGTTGEGLTSEDYESRCNRAAQLFRQLGLHRGDHIAILLPNCLDYFVVAGAALRTGLYVTPISSHLKAEEIRHIVGDCGAQCLVATADLLSRMDGDTVRALRAIFVVGEECPGALHWDTALSLMPDAPVDDATPGRIMFYSSGTTGLPKGIKQPLPPVGDFSGDAASARAMGASWGFGPDTIYLSPAPLYHAAPLRFSIAALRLGASVVFSEKFDPEQTLALVERYGVTHAQFVPTMFVRMLRLADDVRKGYDLSSLTCAIHAAAPCPVDVKRQMIDWFGPIIHEYYAGTEAVGSTRISSAEWLAHPGSVGRPSNCKVHILGDRHEELPAREVGMVYFSGGPAFEYHSDPDKTASVRSPQGWMTFGDCGYLDEDGYLYLTDRKDFMIISGGVNIYPQEIEDVIALHPQVDDVAVIGIPEPEFGQEVKALVKPMPGVGDTAAFEAEILAFCAGRLSSVKCPRSIVVVDALPRSETGKLQKRLLMSAYGAKSAGAVAPASR